MIHLGHPVIRKPQIWSVYNSKTRNRGNSKLLGRIAVIVFNVPFTLHLQFSKIFKYPWSHAIGRFPLNYSNLSLCPFIWNSHLFCLHNFFYFFFMAILEAKIFKIQIFFYIFWKVWTTNTPSVSSWVVEAYISIRLENGYISEKKRG